MLKIYLITDDLDEKMAREKLTPYGEFFYWPCRTEQEIIDNCKDANILISLYEPITSRVMSALTQLRFISLASIGYNTVDMDYATDSKIHVSNNPNYCTEEVADHTVALILALNRGLFQYHKSVQQDKVWLYDIAGPDMHRLSTRTLGLAGFGSIARKVAGRMKAFGSRVMAYDPYVAKEVGEGLGVEIVPLGTLLEESHIISVHMPLTRNTENFFNRERFCLMKQKPMFINCARGGVVDEDDLIEALDNGQVSTAGLDVLKSETPDLENCGFLNRDNVILTPHAAFYSLNSMEESQILTVEHVKCFLQGQLTKIPLVNRVESP